jgi:hypothetical protein
VPGRAPPLPRSPLCRPWSPPRRAASSGQLRTKTSCSPPSLASAIAPQPPHCTPPASSPRRRNSSRGGHRAWPPAPPLAGPFPAATEHGNRSPRTQGPSPARARPTSAGGWPEFGRTAAGRPPGTTLQKKESFQGPHCERVTQIVKVLWLFLVNYLENCRKIGKMQNQFCWVRGELSYNFCYLHMAGF